MNLPDPPLRLVAPPGPFPPMTVLELALARAIMRSDPQALDQVRGTLSDWFLRSVSDADIAAALAHMEREGWMADHNGTGPRDTASWLLTDEGIDVVTSLYGGSIRMIDRGVELARLLAALEELTLSKEPGNDT